MREKTIGDIVQEHFMSEGTLPQQGQYSVVDEAGLAQQTSFGAQLVRVLERHTLHEAWVEKDVVERGYTNTRRVRETQWGPGQAFLIFTPIEASQLARRLEDAHERASTAAQCQADAEHRHRIDIETFTKEREDLAARLKRVNENHAEWSTRAIAAEERGRKMELDLAKVRREIGEAAWKKIVGGT